jgi:hypothetical protein
LKPPQKYALVAGRHAEKHKILKIPSPNYSKNFCSKNRMSFVFFDDLSSCERYRTKTKANEEKMLLMIFLQLSADHPLFHGLSGRYIPLPRR